MSDVASSYISCIQFIRFSIHIVVISNTSCFKQQPAHITIIDCFVSNIFCTQYEASKEELIVQYPNEEDIHDFTLLTWKQINLICFNDKVGWLRKAESYFLAKRFLEIGHLEKVLKWLTIFLAKTNITYWHSIHDNFDDLSVLTQGRWNI